MSVQPMNLPSGLVFFLDFQYGDAGGANGKAAPTGPFGPTGNTYAANSSLYGDTNPSNFGDPTNGLYGAGRFAYSINQFSSSVGITLATASWSQVDYNAELSASIAAKEFTAVTVNTSQLTRPDLKGVRAFVLASGSTVSTATNALLLPQYTFPNAAGTSITFLYTGSVGAANLPQNALSSSIFYNLQPVDNNRGDFEDRLNTSSPQAGGYPNADSTSADQLAIPQINIQMKSEAIVAKTRKLKAQWTPEFAQDLNANTCIHCILDGILTRLEEAVYGYITLDTNNYVIWECQVDISMIASFARVVSVLCLF